MFSLEASGTIAGTITASRWKGRPYFRTTVTPSNPRSGAQVGNRAMFRFLGSVWSAVQEADKATWEALAAATNISAFNAYQSYNQRRWTQFQTPSQVYPAAAVMTPGTLGTLTLTAGVRQVSGSQVITGIDDNWGLLVARSTTTGFTPTASDVVLAVETGFSPTTFVDTPVEPGTYYYRTAAFTFDGVVSSWLAQVSVTVS